MENERDCLAIAEGEITEFYLRSRDFNGMTLETLAKKLNLDAQQVCKTVMKGVAAGRLRVISSEHELNPHIIREGFRSEEIQLKSIRPDNFRSTCVYPSRATLKDRLKEGELIDQPFKKMLAEGAGKLQPVFFELELLEFYRNDPRYSYQFNDIGGCICIEDEHYESKDVAEKDKVLLKAFGIAYDDVHDRYLVAWIGDVAALSSEHQKIWQARRVEKDLKIHPDFYGSQILGRWSDHISIFDAVLHEQRIINAMARAMGKRGLFHTDYGQYLDGKPKEFSFMLRPTEREYQGFIHLLDKLMSDNIDKKFFKGDIDTETDEVRADGKIVVTQKGTIVLLDEWLRKYYQTDNWEHWERAISTFKRVRKERQGPAHTIVSDAFDRSLIRTQRELMQEVYLAHETLRHALSTHPSCEGKDFDIPSPLQARKIWVY